MKQKDIIAAILPVHNRKKITLNCLSKLTGFIDNHYKVEIIVIDDGSSDGTRHKIKEMFPNIKLLIGDGNLLWAGAVNMGLSYVNLHKNCYQYILILNDDNVFTKSTLDNLYFTIKKYGIKVILSSIALNFDSDIIHCSGHKQKGFKRELTPILQGEHYSKNLPRIIDCDSLSSRFVIMPIDVLSNIGFFNNIKFPHNFSDIEYFMRAKIGGYSLLVNTQSVVLTKINENYLKMNLFNKNFVSFFRTFFDVKHPNNLKLMFNKAFCHKPLVLGMAVFIISSFSKIKLIFLKLLISIARSNTKTQKYFS